MGPVWGLLVCGYGLTERGRPSRPVSGLAGANVANGGPLITVWTLVPALDPVADELMNTFHHPHSAIAHGDPNQRES